MNQPVNVVVFTAPRLGKSRERVTDTPMMAAIGPPVISKREKANAHDLQATFVYSGQHYSRR
ncbi:MAG: hypothetical protein ACRD9Y_18455, partial [Blastocatellia bacterium]